MTLPLSIADLEKAKFIDDSGNVCIRVVPTTASGTSGVLGQNIDDLEQGKFVEDINGDVAIVLLTV